MEVRVNEAASVRPRLRLSTPNLRNYYVNPLNKVMIAVSEPSVKAGYAMCDSEKFDFLLVVFL